MHEASIVQSIFESTAESMRKEGLSRVTRIKIAVGGMHHLVPEVMNHYFDLMKQEWSGFETAILVMDIIDVKVRCRKCGWFGPVEPPIFMCEHCNSFETDMIQGKELLIESIRGEAD